MEKITKIGKQVKEEWKAFWSEEDAMGSVEIILIIVVLVGLVLIFREQVLSIVKDAFSRINSGKTGITEEMSI